MPPADHDDFRRNVGVRGMMISRDLQKISWRRTNSQNNSSPFRAALETTFEMPG